MGDVIKYILKITIITGLAATLFSAFYLLVSAINFPNSFPVLGEIMALINIYLPFNANSFFAMFGVVGTAIVSFMISRKMYDLLSGMQRDAS